MPIVSSRWNRKRRGTVAMRRIDVHVKVELVIDDEERPDRVAAEICRLIKKVYGVRTAEVSNLVDKDA